jgi:hypothetical protein
MKRNEKQKNLVRGTKTLAERKRFKQKSFEACEKRPCKFCIICMDVIQALKERNYNETTLKKYNLSVVFDKKEKIERLRFLLNANDQTDYTDWSPVSKTKYKHSYGLNVKINGFNFTRHVNTKEPIFVTEGVFDCLRLEQLGYNAVANLGLSLYKPLDLIERGYNVVLAFDNDISGKRATNAIIDNLHSLHNVSVLDYVANVSDPDCFKTKNDFRVLPLKDFLIQQINNDCHKGTFNFGKREGVFHDETNERINAHKKVYNLLKRFGLEPFINADGWFQSFRNTETYIQLIGNAEQLGYKKIGQIKKKIFGG